MSGTYPHKMLVGKKKRAIESHLAAKAYVWPSFHSQSPEKKQKEIGLKFLVKVFRFTILDRSQKKQEK